MSLLYVPCTMDVAKNKGPALMELTFYEMLDPSRRYKINI